MHQEYQWNLPNISYARAKELILDLGFDDQSPKVQMRRAFSAMLGILVGFRNGYCGTVKHCERITKALDIIKDIVTQESKARPCVEANIKSDGQITVSDVSQVTAGIKVMQFVDTPKLISVKERTEFDQLEFERVCKRNEKFIREFGYEHFEKKREFDMATQVLAVEKRKIERVRNDRFMEQDIKDYLISDIKKTCERTKRVLERKKIVFENSLMEREDWLSKAVEKSFKTIRDETYSPGKVRWKAEKWQVPTRTFKMNQRAFDNLKAALKLSHPRYMRYFYYSHKRLQQYEKEEITSVSSRSKTSKLAVKRELYPKLNWEDLDKLLIEYDKPLEKSECEAIINAAYKTEQLLKTRNKVEYEPHVWSCLPDVINLVPTYIRRFCSDFINSQMFKRNFKKLRSKRLKELLDIRSNR